MFLTVKELQYKKEEYAEAEVSFVEILKIYEELDNDNRNEYFPDDVADIFIRLGFLQYMKEEYAEAEASFKEALKKYKKLNNECGDIRNIADAFLFLGNSQNKKQKYAEAEVSYKEALKAYKKIGKWYSGDSHLPYLAKTLISLSALSTDKKTALKYADETVKILNKHSNSPLAQEYLVEIKQIIENWNNK